MKMVQYRRLCVVLGAALATACTSDTSTTPQLTDASRTISWSLAIESFSGGPGVEFGARIWLDGEAIYVEPALRSQGHGVSVARTFGNGRHVVDFEILSASADPALYVARCSAGSSSGRPLINADGVPTSLRIGERVTYRLQF